MKTTEKMEIILSFLQDQKETTTREIGSTKNNDTYMAGYMEGLHDEAATIIDLLIGNDEAMMTFLKNILKNT